VRQKVVPDEEAQEHKVVEEAIVVQSEGHGHRRPHVMRQVLAQDPDVQQLDTSYKYRSTKSER
jgi:hypothetical protein